jgi:hypothetical protein|tara:strand:+ start:236 stop:511 length:276 start_codon:yes stop_codon:yes gene_type:complete
VLASSLLSFIVVSVENDLYRWWEAKCGELFGKRAVGELRGFATYEEVLSRKSGIDDYEILLLPKSMPKTEMHERVGKLITSIKEDEVKLHE